MKDVSKTIVCAIGLVVCVACASAGPQTVAETGNVEEAPATSPNTTTPEEVTGETETKLKNTLRWTTASEVENFGFDIYRSTSEDGTFERMTAEPLAGAGTVDEPQNYVWYDTAIEPGVDYYYYIESISMAGVRERFSPIIKSPAKY